jgi:hypothetical protein
VLSGGTLPFLAFLHAPQTRAEGITQVVSQELDTIWSSVGKQVQQRSIIIVARVSLWLWTAARGGLAAPEGAVGAMGHHTI